MKTALASLSALVLLTACSGGTDTSTTSDPTSAPATSPVAGSSASGGGSPTGGSAHTDASLEKLVTGITVEGKTAEVFPIAEARKSFKATPPRPVTPTACNYVLHGVTGPISEGRPAAMALLEGVVTISVVEMASEKDAQELIASRDTALGATCRAATTTVADGSSQRIQITQGKAQAQGLTDAKLLTGRVLADGELPPESKLLGRKGTLLVQVSAMKGRERVIEDVTAQVVSRIR